jgi:hypothetical protein
VLLAAYRDLERRVGLLTTARGAKTEMVLDALQTIRGEFSVKALQERCPHVSIDRFAVSWENNGRPESSNVWAGVGMRAGEKYRYYPN